MSATIIGTEVVFDKAEKMLAIATARARADAAPVTEAAGVRRGTYSPYDIELTGTIGEIAVARFYDVEPDLEIYRERKEAGADLTVKGVTVNVKATIVQPVRRPKLLVRHYDTRYDAYLLCCVRWLSPSCGATVVGWAPRVLVESKVPGFFADRKVKTRIVEYGELSSPYLLAMNESL